MSDGSTTEAKLVPGTWSLLRRFWAFARPHQRWIWFGMAMIPLVAGLTTLRPLLLKEAIDGPLSPPVQTRGPSKRPGSRQNAPAIQTSCGPSKATTSNRTAGQRPPP